MVLQGIGILLNYSRLSSWNLNNRKVFSRLLNFLKLFVTKQKLISKKKKTVENWDFICPLQHIINQFGIHKFTFFNILVLFHFLLWCPCSYNFFLFFIHIPSSSSYLWANTIKTKYKTINQFGMINMDESKFFHFCNLLTFCTDFHSDEEEKKLKTVFWFQSKKKICSRKLHS